MDDRQFEFFDRFTPVYDDERLQFALADIQRSEPGSLSVIDVGCGNGSTLLYLQSNWPLAEVAGIDPAKAYIEQAMHRVSGEFSVGSVLDEGSLSDHRGRWDRVVIASVLHHLVGRTVKGSKQNVVRALRNGLSLLRPGGRLLVFEPVTEPALAVGALFWIKKLGVVVFGNRRVELGARWANVGAPLVSFLGHDELQRLTAEAGGRLLSSEVMAEQRYGLVRRRNVGYTIAAPR